MFRLKFSVLCMFVRVNVFMWLFSLVIMVVMRMLISFVIVCFGGVVVVVGVGGVVVGCNVVVFIV